MKLFASIAIGVLLGIIGDPEVALALETDTDRTVTVDGLPCTEYVVQELAKKGIDVQEKINLEGAKNPVSIRDAVNMNQRVLPGTKTNEDLDALVKAKDVRTKGVVTALVQAGLGTEVPVSTDLSKLKEGDVVQYWYWGGTTRLGHAAIVEAKAGSDGKVTLRGSQKGVVGTFRTTLHGADFKYAVRIKSVSKH